MNAYSFYNACPDRSAQRQHQAALTLADNAASRAHRVLRTEMVEALLNDPQRKVQTPGFNLPAMTAAEVVNDNFAGTNGDASLLELLRIVGLCAAGNSTPELHLRASAWIAGAAAEHAAFHRDDLADQLEAE